MKKILGLDLGTNSIGWALVNEAENPTESSSIIRIGVRVNPLTADEKNNFEAGKSITTNSDRALKRSMRRNLQRYKLRRDALIDVLRRHGWITDNTILAEQGENSTFHTLKLRAKAATEEISLEDLAKVLLMLNKKRGYRSSRKAKEENEGQTVDSMETAKRLHETGMTPGELAFRMISDGKFNIPDFYRSDLLDEFDRIWTKQHEYYPEILTDNLKEGLKDKNESQTWKICETPFGIEGIKRTTKGKDLIRENYEWRAKAIKEMLDLESLAIVLQKVNGQIKNAGGYLGNISDRSKELYFNGQTVGQHLAEQIENDPHTSLKNQVYYRQDYMDEFEKIWKTQAGFHPELTPELKKEIKDTIIFWQRPLKSQKGLVNVCEFEHWETTTDIDGKIRTKTVGPKVCPKSSPLFQEFKIWQIINNLKVNGQDLEQEDKKRLAAELSIKDKMSGSEVLKFLYRNPGQLSINFKTIDGNRTGAALFRAFAKIMEVTGHGEYDDIIKLPSEKALKRTEEIFSALGFNTDILHFDSSLKGSDMEKQPMFRLWHLLYSYEGDKSRSGNDSLAEKISGLFGFDMESAKIIANVTFAPDYGSLSSKAIRHILPYMKEGMEYSVACENAGYRHSAKSLTKEERDSKVYKDRLEQLPKNSLRNPVVEKILNQMTNVVNGIIDEYGKPDEIRIELARELKKSQQERKSMSDAISKATKENDNIRRELLQADFGIANPSRNDIIRYKLYKELESNGYKTLYTGTYISREKLFSKEFDIEHIIPQAKLFDDSLANKTLEARQANIEKGDKTAFDYVKSKFGDNGAEEYRARIEKLFKDGIISRAKRKNLLTAEKDIPSGFIERDLRDSQYIAKKAKEMLEDIVGQVVTTTGSVTDRLREDWQLVDVMKELNWNKYDRLELTETWLDKDGRTVRKIKDWTKRNDHRHHAMDALTIAFTKRSYIQYLNNLNARIRKDAGQTVQLNLFELNDIPKKDLSKEVMGIEKTQLYRDNKGKLRFIPPIPLDIFRAEAKRHLENTLVSIKAKNKVATRNVNISKKKGEVNKKVQLTPRGQLHNETIYGSIRRYTTKEEKVGANFNAEKIESVAKPLYRNALKKRLELSGNDPKKAFTGKNSLEKNPLYVDEMHTISVPAKVMTFSLEKIYTTRKEINPTNFKDTKSIEKVIDVQIRRVLLKRLEEFGGNATKAFSNLDENPIWLNEKKGIAVKSVTITGVSNAIALHDKHDNLGHPVTDEYGRKQPSDYVSTSNNHHIAIFRDAEGNLQEEVVPFFDAMERLNQGLPVINRDFKKDEGWKFLFTMKQNEYFVFPNPETGFDPNEIDLMNPDNYALISPNLFRVQKLATKNYHFRHHLETTVEDNPTLRDVTWKRIQNVNGLKSCIKVRIDHLGRIVHVGEY